MLNSIRLLRALFSLTFGACLSSVAGAQTPVFLNVPKFDVFGNGNRAGGAVYGVNDQGQVVGMMGERNWTIWGLPHAYIIGNTGFGTGALDPDDSLGRAGGFRLGRIDGPIRDTFTTQAPSATYRYLDLRPELNSEFNLQVTNVQGINNSGVVVGYLSTDYLNRGPNTPFIYDTNSGSLQVLTVPNAVSAEAVDINNLGVVIGNYRDSANRSYGFRFESGVFSTIENPASIGRTNLGGINDAGTIVGASGNVSDPRSFILRAGNFSYFTADNAFTQAFDINNSEQIVGSLGVSGKRRGFVYQNGVTQILDYAGANSTYAYTINNLGVVGGVAEGIEGFLVQVSPIPDIHTWLGLTLGLGLLPWLTRRVST